MSVFFFLCFNFSQQNLEVLFELLSLDHVFFIVARGDCNIGNKVFFKIVFIKEFKEGILFKVRIAQACFFFPIIRPTHGNVRNCLMFCSMQASCVAAVLKEEYAEKQEIIFFSFYFH